jgi:carboxylesterase
LLCHGLTGSPASLRPWAEHLAATGCAVSLPRLPGHGLSWQQLNRTRWQDWYAETAAALARLNSRCEHVVVAGLSMGGCLALRLAEEHPQSVAGLVLVNPAVASSNPALRALPLLRFVVRSRPGIGSDIKAPHVREGEADRLPLRALHSLTLLWKHTRADLGKVTAPILLLRSVEDHVVDPLSARIILAGVSSRDVEELLLHDSYHVATLDNDAPRIFAATDEFLRRVTSTASVGGGTDAR